jgi:CSLREA domain-containing protein
MRRLLTATTVFGCALLAAAMADSVAAEPKTTFVVTKLVEGADDVDEDPGDGVCATAESECTLRAAVQESNALPGRQTISLPIGEYALWRGGWGENAADTGDVDITDDTTIIGAGRDQTSISEISGQAGVERIFDVRSPAMVTMRDLTVRDVFMSSILSAEESCGGGFRNAGSLILVRVDIINNVFRRSGAGICNQGDLHVADSTISGNHAAVVGGGGGILNKGTAVLERVAISGNIADSEGGGGIYNLGSPYESTLTLTDSTISGNRATVSIAGGGGIANARAGAEATVVNSVISGNETLDTIHGTYDSDGGGVSAFGGARIALVNSTVTGNRSRGSGGLSSTPHYVVEPGVISLVNTVISGNQGGDCAGPMNSQGHNLDSDGTCGLDAEGDLSGVDPMLGPLADNGGPTQTHALLEGSPAIDAGGADGCPEHDQRGAPRPFDGDGVGGPVCDIGAFEFGAEPGPFPPPQSGDADCNSSVEAVDALSVLRHVAALPPRAACLELGDVNCDTAIDAVDALLVLRYVAALPVSLPPGCPPIGPPPI